MVRATLAPMEVIRIDKGSPRAVPRQVDPHRDVCADDALGSMRARIGGGSVADRQPTEFGWFLLRHMAAAELSQAELARRIDVSQSTVSRWIYRTGRPDPDKLDALAGVLGITKSELLTITGYGSPADD